MILSVKETFDGRGGEEDAKFETQFRRVYVVESDVLDEDVLVVKFAVDPDDGEAIPSIGDQHPEPIPGGRVALASNIKTDQRTDAPQLWTVTVDYSTVFNPSDADPLQRPPEISFSTQVNQVAAQQGGFISIPGAQRVERPVVNSAGDPFDPPIMIDDVRLVLTVRKNHQFYPRAKIKTHVNHVNDDVWYGFDIGTVKCQGIDADYVIENNVGYWKTTYVFHIKIGAIEENSWLYFILDAGMRELDTNNKRIQIIDERGSQASSPAPLDGQGHKLSEADIAAGNFEFRVYEFYGFVDFSGAAGLGLDNLPL